MEENEKINDEYIINLFFTSKGFINPNKTKKYYNNKFEPKIYTYIINRFNDSNSLVETLIRIKQNIEIKPICPICGKKLKYSGNCKIPYYKYCSDICSNKDSEKNKKIYQTMLKHFGENNKFNRNKAIHTYNNKSEEEKQKIRNKRSISLKNKTLEEKQKIQDKTSKTIFKKYGCLKIRQVESVIKKGIQTRINKYGSPNNHKKYVETCLKKYGVDNHLKVKEISSKIANSEIRKQHEYETKKKNHTFNSSKPENESFELLKQKYPDVIHHFKDKDRYPFICDFYIPNLDLFIECQYGQFHNGKPYLGTKEDLEEVELLKQKSEKKKQETGKQKSRYDSVIDTWTIRDPLKRKIAKENKLNYIEFWNINELKEWLNN